MIKIGSVEVFGFNAALRGMRNPMNSWDKSDSVFTRSGTLVDVGDNDYKLMMGLSKAGNSHRKFLRMIHVQMDVTAPLSWWRDYDAYKVGTVANSASTMHKIHHKPFELSDFTHEHLHEKALNQLKMTIETLEAYRQIFLESELKDRTVWRSMIDLLPNSYNQLRTIDLNYEVLVNLSKDRRGHKQKEFDEFIDYCIEHLPYFKDVLEVCGGR